MAGIAIKLTKFLGEAPKISPELLPDTVAQFAFNLDLSSGDLTPYRRPELLVATGLVDAIRTIYPMLDGSGNKVWLRWTSQVDIAAAPTEGDTDQRVYYTGDGVPKTTTYTLATSGADLPSASYVLGLPLPTDIPTAAAVTFAQKSATTRARDAGNTATITTSVAHGLTTGDYATTTGFAGAAYNLSNVRVTVTSPTTFTYFSFGAAEGSVADTAGRIDLAGTTLPRNYVFTYYTAWEEESVPSEPSPTIFVKEGQGVTLTALPSLWVHGDGYQTTGMVVRMYRTVAGVLGTDYFLVGDLPLSTGIAGTYSQTGTTVVVTATAHGLANGALVTLQVSTGDTASAVYTISGVTTNTFNVSEATVQTTSGALLYAPALTFLDEQDVMNLDTLLESVDYDPPDPAMVGLLAIHNSMMVGFFSNTVCFSEPGKPHAWPIKYRQQVDRDITALGAYGMTLLALTDKTPWLFDGNNPAAISQRRTDYVLPCLSRASVVNVGFGVVWSSAGGLAVYSTSIGVDYLTKNVHSWSTWPTAITPANLSGFYYRGRYFGSDGVNTFLFERDEQVGGNLVETDIAFTAGFYEPSTDRFYYAHEGNVYLWDSPNSANSSIDWKSKVFTFKAPINFGAARVIADYAAQDGGLAADNAARLVANEALLAAGDVGGYLGGDTLGLLYTSGSRLQSLAETDTSVTFQLYADKNLVMSTSILDSGPFRLPTGYRTDTYEMRVSTNIRVRAVHIAETAIGLKEV